VSATQRKEIPRGERVLPGIWRLRLPLPWPGVPHGNAWAVAADGGVVLFDTGYAGEDGTRGLEMALAQVGFDLADVKLVACTHTHSDHYGLAGPIADAAGCEVWLHPRWAHIRRIAEDPEAAMERRFEVARQSGVPIEPLRRFMESRKDTGTGVARIVSPDRELVPGVEIETDLGIWQIHETPGHAPSHVVFHQTEKRLLISGDHLLGRVSVFFDYGHSPDPVSEFVTSLDSVADLDVGLCLAGHGRPFRDAGAKVAANRQQVTEQLERVRKALDGEPKTAFEVVAEMLGHENLSPATAPWGLQLALAYIDHLMLAGEAEEVGESDPRRFQLLA
jgi:glyoxylase-like metal-dependent hydrolase (beta-lactamase superfamily II)